MNVINYFKKYIRNLNENLPLNGWICECIKINKAELMDTKLYSYTEKFEAEINIHILYNLDVRCNNIQIFILCNNDGNTIVIGKIYKKDIVCSSVMEDTFNNNDEY